MGARRIVGWWRRAAVIAAAAAALSGCPVGPDGTFTVTYAANGATSGTVPMDSTSYATGATVTVLGNTGSLAKSGSSFSGWNTAANGSGTAYAAGGTFAMGSAAVTLYAAWSAPTTVVSVYPADGATIGAGIPSWPRNDTITVVFSASMDTASQVLGGALGSQADGGTWSTTTVPNDTLTISPHVNYSSPYSRYYFTASSNAMPLLVDVTDAGGTSLSTISLSYSVDNDDDAMTDEQDACPFDPNCY